MSETFSKVDVITGVARRRRFTTEQKLLVAPLAHESPSRCGHHQESRGLTGRG
jgi:hypothetical protein